jgi:hypothetical protein
MKEFCYWDVSLNKDGLAMLRSLAVQGVLAMPRGLAVLGWSSSATFLAVSAAAGSYSNLTSGEKFRKKALK